MNARYVYTSREFKLFVKEAKQAANDEPVFITNRGEPTHVLLAIHEYRRLQGKELSVADALSRTGIDTNFDYEFPSF
ncbi:hypothetical protein PTKU64_88220 [Paraburkholderia terrae]|uniref:Antitoxin n=1 Tax=Paraburkholderia terrae TaxID=311230 RepID=A0ABM7U1J3_9BURK|nr:type II toxin-antitoxin system prevent-host-death family antitoxin [Paraburkholderia terrae]BCZ85147.1 hypothetical protein PTKU64_88220 [Paraburkholderia terrae]